MVDGASRGRANSISSAHSSRAQYIAEHDDDGLLDPREHRNHAIIGVQTRLWRNDGRAVHILVQGVFYRERIDWSRLPAATRQNEGIDDRSGNLGVHALTGHDLHERRGRLPLREASH